MTQLSVARVRAYCLDQRADTLVIITVSSSAESEAIWKLITVSLEILHSEWIF